MWKEWAYLVSISLQLSGALILLVFSTSGKREKIIVGFVQVGFTSKDGDSRKINYSHDAFRDAFRMAYLNKSAFLYISLGYALGVLGKQPESNQGIAILIIAIICIICLFLTSRIVDRLLMNSKKVETEITEEELEELGIETFMESIPEHELERILSEG